MRRWAGVALAMAGLLGACAPAPGATGPAQPADGSVPVTVAATGELDCIASYGCQAVLSILVLPAGATPPPAWYEHAQVEFETVSDDWRRLAGGPIDPPTSIEAGEYVVVAGTRLTSDVSSHDPDGNVVFQAMGASSCEARLVVDAGAGSVAIAVDFDGDGLPCAVDVTVD